MKRALVTGATGCLGRHLAIRLAAEGWEVTGMGRQQEIGILLQAAGVRFIKGDIRDVQAVDAACAHQDVVFHCAALSSPWGNIRISTAVMCRNAASGECFCTPSGAAVRACLNAKYLF